MISKFIPSRASIRDFFKFSVNWDTTKNNTILITNENMVVLYLPLYLFRFFSAKSASIPNMLRVNFEVFTSFPVSFTSAVWRMASIAEIFDALLAGTQVEINIVDKDIKTAIMIVEGNTTTRKLPETVNRLFMIGLIKKKVIPIPANLREFRPGCSQHQ